MSDEKPPTEPSAIIIPFGKHKGKTVGELLARDPAYADWITAQGWVADRFAELHAAIVTRGAGTDDTPEHNALQARFLGEQFRVTVLAMAIPNELNNSLESAKYAFTSISDHEIELNKNPRPSFAAISDERADRARSRLERVASGSVDLTTTVKFEQSGVDVIIEYRWNVGASDRPGGSVPVELKPSIGDDFPSIMRQMRRLDCKICIAGQYTGRGISEPQLRQMFEANGQKIIFVQEIEEEMRRVAAQ